MKKSVMILLVVMVILIGFSCANAQENESVNGTENKTNQSQFCIPSVFIHPEIIPALDKNGSVYVGVGIKDTSGIIIDSGLSREESISLTKQREEYKRNISEQIRRNLTIDEFNVTRVSIDGVVFFGSITKKGLEKLNSSCHIKNIAIPIRGNAGWDEFNETNQILDIQNQTETKIPVTSKPQSFFQRIINFFKSLFGLR